MNWSELTKDIIGTKYEWGGSVPGKGLDCIWFLIHVLERQGYTIDRNEQIGDLKIGLSNYNEISNHALKNALLLEWLYSHTSVIEMSEARPGDIAMIEYKKNTIPAILDANGKTIICFVKFGIKVMSRMNIIEYRRWGAV